MFMLVHRSPCLVRAGDWKERLRFMALPRAVASLAYIVNPCTERELGERRQRDF